MAWPLPRQFDAALFAPVPFDVRYSAEWWQVKEDEARAGRERQQREARQGARKLPSTALVGAPRIGAQSVISPRSQQSRSRTKPVAKGLLLNRELDCNLDRSLKLSCVNSLLRRSMVCALNLLANRRELGTCVFGLPSL